MEDRPCTVMNYHPSEPVNQMKSQSNLYDYQIGSAVNQSQILNKGLFKLETKEDVKRRKEEMKTISFDSLYPFKPVKLLYQPEKSSIISWHAPKVPD